VSLPYDGIRILEKSATLAGRLAGLLFADQGAEVFVERPDADEGEHDAYLDRGKVRVAPGGLSDISSADVIIVDGAEPVNRGTDQTVLRVTAALPGDEAYGHLEADCSEDLLNALVGIFTDMSIFGAILGRPVIYTPLPICSVYAGVHGAIAIAAALVDRERTGVGREIIASRLAGGLSAVGALTLTSSGVPEHLAPASIGDLPAGLTPERFQEIARAAAADASRELWLAQRYAPLSQPYRAADGRFVLPMVSANRRLTERFLRALDLWGRAIEAGMVSESSYDSGARQYAGRNLGDALSLDFTHTSMLADWIEAAFARKPAAEWEQELCGAGVPCVEIKSWEEWKQDPQARAAGIFDEVQGSAEQQIGRSAWVASARPYPPLESCRQADGLPTRDTPRRSREPRERTELPLQGFTVVDLCNVIAGPACGRVFVELGATVVKVEPMRPLHPPTITVTWSGELSAGKHSIILDAATDEGRDILHRLVSGADLVLANKLDPQLERLGLDSASLAALNPSAIGVQLSAHRGERRSARHDYPGYDPALQGLTGIMVRFGAEGCPTFHGIASCVDYLCGYLGTWAGVTALAARERRGDGRGDWAEASLATAATLVQLLLQQSREPESARGASATGGTAGARVYELSDGWIFAQAPHDVSAQLASKTVVDALQQLAADGIAAVPVQSLRRLVERHRVEPTKTVRFERREREGWETECFAPAWYAFDGVPGSRPAAAARIGADAPAILAEFGYAAVDVERLMAEGVVGPTEWNHQGRGS
jgi:crotonobetainyl-CoA:carnitine CoA-transferase CaiB-like acyl-CoA transferase